MTSINIDSQLINRSNYKIFENLYIRFSYLYFLPGGKNNCLHANSRYKYQ